MLWGFFLASGHIGRENQKASFRPVFQRSDFDNRRGIQGRLTFNGNWPSFKNFMELRNFNSEVNGIPNMWNISNEIKLYDRTNSKKNKNL